MHDGHIDVLDSATKAVSQRDSLVSAITIVPNSTEYVRNKLGEAAETWTMNRRIREIEKRARLLPIPTYIDDVSSKSIGLGKINEVVPRTIERFLGYSSIQSYFVVGSDQVLSMEEHLANDNN